MLHKISFFVGLVLLPLFSCSRASPYSSDAQDYGGEAILKNRLARIHGQINPGLPDVWQPLFDYCRKEGFSSQDILKDIRWMDNYRRQLGRYYRETYGTDSLSEFDRTARLVLGSRLLLDNICDHTVVGERSHYEYNRCFAVFEQFNEYSRLRSACKSPEGRKWLYEEFAVWLQLRHCFSKFYCDCVELEYYECSMSGPIASAGVVAIWKTHADLYRKEFLILSDPNAQYEDKGVWLDCSKQLFLECCRKTLRQYNREKGKELGKGYGGHYDSAVENLGKICVLIDNWIEKRNRWIGEVTTDWLRPEYPRHTSEVLLDLSAVISSIR